MRTITISVPEKVLVSENGTAQNQPQSSETSKLVKANATLVVWIVFLAIGGGILALYYARVGYLPEIEWNAVLIYLFVGTMVGGTLGLLLTMSVFLPGLIWSEFIISDRNIEKHFSYDVERKEPCMRSIITCLGKPFLLVLLISHVLLLVGRAFKYWTFAAGILILTFWIMRLRFKWILLNVKFNSNAFIKDKLKGVLTYGWFNLSHAASNLIRALRGQPRRNEYKARQTFKYSFWFTLSVLLSQISMYVIYRLSDSPKEAVPFTALTLLCTSIVWISNHAVSAIYRNHPRQAVVAALVAAGLLLFTADNFSSLSMRLMNNFGLGYSHSQRFNLRVNDDGARTVHELDLKCGDSYHYLCDVEILSKVGDHYYLRVGGKQHTTLPKSHVVSIQRIEAQSKVAQGGQN